MQPVTDAVPTAERYRRFAEVEARGMSPAYERLALAVAGDARVLDLLEQVRPEQRQPNLLLGALRWHDVPTDDAAAALAWAVDHPAPVLEVLRTRFTQTNEAARCALLLPALTQVAGGGPVALLELGASAGLCLLYDRYRYRYVDAEGGEHVVGDGTPELSCRVSGGVPLPSAVPEIRWRAGIDRNPLDPADPIDARWLECLVWPEHHERAARLTAALATAAADPPRVVRGDLATDLAALLDEVPAGLTTVVTHTAVLAYVAPDVGDAVRRTCRESGAWRLGAEGQRVLPDLIAPAGADPADFLVSVGDPDGHDDVVAVAQPHGRWLRWAGDRAAATGS